MSNYVCSDLHGMGELWKKIQEHLTLEDTLYFLGDAADRGPDGYEIIKSMIADPRVIYIKGNHENLLVEGMLTSNFGEKRYSDNFDLWMFNGGYDTFTSMLEDDKETVKTIVEHLDALPYRTEYLNKDGILIHLCHAGYTPWDKNFPTKYDLIWDRSHFCDPYKKGCYDIVIHGHTPAPHLAKCLSDYKRFYNDDSINYYEQNGAIIYCDRHKIDIDCGSAFTHKTVLVNLDTLEFIPIVMED